MALAFVADEAERKELAGADFTMGYHAEVGETRPINFDDALKRHRWITTQKRELALVRSRSHCPERLFAKSTTLS